MHIYTGHIHIYTQIDTHRHALTHIHTLCRYTCTQRHIHMCTETCKYTDVHALTHIHRHSYAKTCIRIYTDVYVQTQAHTKRHTSTQTHTDMHTLTHIYTNTHRHTPWRPWVAAECRSPCRNGTLGGGIQCNGPRFLVSSKSQAGGVFIW